MCICVCSCVLPMVTFLFLLSFQAGLASLKLQMQGRECSGPRTFGSPAFLCAEVPVAQPPQLLKAASEQEPLLEVKGCLGGPSLLCPQASRCALLGQGWHRLDLCFGVESTSSAVSQLLNLLLRSSYYSYPPKRSWIYFETENLKKISCPVLPSKVYRQAFVLKMPLIFFPIWQS